MDRHFFISVYACKSNRMGEELGSYVVEKYHHMVIHEDDIYDIKADIQAKMQVLEEKYKRCKPFRIRFCGYPDRYKVECPHIIVLPDYDTDKTVLSISTEYIRNDILEYRRP